MTRRELAWRIAMVLSAVCLGAAGYALGHRTAANSERLAETQKTLSYICSTTSVLDALATQARDQIQTAIDNGTYARLLKQGIVTRANIVEARRTKKNYQAAHLLLQANGSCAALAT